MSEAEAIALLQEVVSDDDRLFEESAWCVFCRGNSWDHPKHKPDCLVVRIHAFLGDPIHPTPGVAAMPKRDPNKLIYKEHRGAGFDISPTLAIIIFFAILIILSLTGRL